MTIRTELDVEDLKARVKTLEKAVGGRVSQVADKVGVATKDDLDAFLARLRAFEADLSSIKKRLKL